MKNKLIYFGAVVAAVAAHSYSGAYELGTHARITYKAYAQSTLIQDQNLIKSLGIDTLVSLNPSNPFGETYYDVSGAGVLERNANSFEKGFMIEREDNLSPVIPPNVTDLSLPGWLLRGAIREDDVMWPAGDNPQDDPYSTLGIMRVCNHFYDPITNQPLTIKGIKPCSLLFQPNEIAPRWAIGSNDVFISPNTPEAGRRNHFTIFDAREAMYRALTGKNNNGVDVATTKEERNKYWATLFRALGDVVHLVQDMGQPQHTRNDPHAGKQFDGNTALLGHKSVYETYVEARATGGAFNVPGVLTVNANGLTYDGYSLPRFTDYLSYFTARHKEGDILKRQGLADYSNRGFFSAGTNIGAENNVYTLPAKDPNTYTPTDLYVDWEGQSLGSDPNAKVTILQGLVPDSLPGGQPAVNIPLTTYGLWDQFLQPQGKADYSLNRYNYDAMANLLIPRAVAYSAGLIDYFFRGRLETVDAHYTANGISLRLRNAIDPTQTPAWANEALGPGTLALAFDYEINGRKYYGKSADVLAFQEPMSLRPGKTSETTYAFTLPPIPATAQHPRFRVVFRGRLGQEEDAVVAGPLRVASGFIVTPNYVPADGITGARQIYKPIDRWVLSDEKDVFAGNIDWKGWYVDGKPTKTLSWSGPAARHFPDAPPITYPITITAPNVFGQGILQGGEVFALAPAPVLGAALMKDPQGGEWLVAICKGSDNSDIVYRRPYQKSATTEGWQVIGSFPPRQGFLEADRPWFFSGNGTEAQTMRRSDAEGLFNLTRLKITISGDTASLSILGNTEIFYTLHSPAATDSVSDNGVEGQSCSQGYTEYTSNYRYDLTNKELTRGKHGAYAVAVDYGGHDGTDEILATVEYPDSRDTSVWSGYRYNKSVITCTSKTLDTGAGVDYSRNVDVTAFLKFGDTRLELARRTGSVSGKYQTSQNGPITDDSYPADESSVTVQGSISMRNKIIRYIDLRNDMVAYIQRNTLRQYLPPVLYDYVGRWVGNILRADEQWSLAEFIHHAGDTIAADAGERVDRNFVSTEDGTLFGAPEHIKVALPPDEWTTAVKTRLPAKLALYKAPRSWAADAAGNIALSQQRLSTFNDLVFDETNYGNFDVDISSGSCVSTGPSNQGSVYCAYDYLSEYSLSYFAHPNDITFSSDWFSYITDGELGSIVPGVSGNASFNYTGVIH